jgi:hypothetical protein
MDEDSKDGSVRVCCYGQFGVERKKQVSIPGLTEG